MGAGGAAFAASPHPQPRPHKWGQGVRSLLGVGENGLVDVFCEWHHVCVSGSSSGRTSIRTPCPHLWGRGRGWGQGGDHQPDARNVFSEGFDTRNMARRRMGNEGAFAARAKVERARALRREMTPAERALWEVLRGSSLGLRVRPQHVIRGWIVDFYAFAASLVIEVDGDVHDLQGDEDERRTDALRAEGLAVLRFRNNEVLTHLPGVVARIVDAIHRPEGSPRLPASASPGALATSPHSLPPRVGAGPGVGAMDDLFPPASRASDRALTLTE